MSELPGWFAEALEDAGVHRAGDTHTTVGRYLAGDVDPRLDGDLVAVLRAGGVDDTGLAAVGDGLEQAALTAKDLEDATTSARLLGLAAQAFEAAGRPLRLAWAVYVRGGQLRTLDRYEEAVAAFESAETLFRELDDDEHVSDAAYQAGATWQVAGRDDLAEISLVDAAAWYAEHGDLENHAYCALLLGRIAAGREEWASSIGHLQQAIAGFDAAGRGTQRGHARFLLGATLWSARRYEDAVAELARAREILDDHDEMWHCGACDFLMGEAHFGNGDYDAARAAWTSALTVFELIGDEDEVVACRAQLAALPP